MKENVSSLKAAEELEIALLSQKGLVSSYLLDNNPIWLKTLEEKKKDFEVWFKRAQEVALTDNEKKILKDIQLLYKNYDNQRNRVIRTFQSGNPMEAKRILLSDVKTSIDLLYQKCEDLILANEALIAEAEASSQGNVVRMTALIWVTIAFTLFLGGLMGFLIARKINEQLVRSAKLASLGQLSANIAHEIRNPLASIKMRLYTLKQELTKGSAVKDDIQVIEEEIERMEKTVKSFLDFAKLPPPNLEKSRIIPLIESTINLVTPKMSLQNIQIQKKFAVDNLEAVIDKEQIRQVLLNVMLNAIEAMPNDGTLEIGACINNDKNSSKTLDITVKDTGVGISTEIQKKILEPFFTTKADGTGLGLFIASRIMQAHNGKIEIDSRVGEGTVVTLKIPVS